MNDLPSRNLEIKVRVDDTRAEDMRRRLERLTCQPFVLLHQVDEYFGVSTGRLKLRRSVAGEPGGQQQSQTELIAYHRPMEHASRWSDYVVAPLTAESADAVRAALAATHTVTARVEKRRLVAFIGQTRVHLDDVVGLGRFVELETVVKGQDDESAVREHRQVLSLLELNANAAIDGSYLDLVTESGTGS